MLFDAASLPGISAALAATTVINGGVVAVKRAVSRAPAEGALLRRLVRDPFWLFGISLQFFVGTPLTIVATALVGPAVAPGVMAFGLVALALLSAAVNGERLGRRGAAGIAAVVAAVLLIASGGLRVDVGSLDRFGAAVRVRFAWLSGACAAAAALFCLAGFRAEVRARRRRAAVFFALGNGFIFAFSNLLLGPLSAAGVRAVRGEAGTAEWFVLAGCLLGIGFLSLLTVGVSPRALRAGAASVVVPVQQAPIQIVPVLSFFLVYRPFLPDAVRTLSACVGALLVLLGAGILAASGKRGA